MRIAVCGTWGVTQGTARERYTAYVNDCAAMFPMSQARDARFLTYDEMVYAPSLATHVLLLNGAEDFDARFAHLGPSKILHVVFEPKPFQRLTPRQATIIGARARASINGTHPREMRQGYVLIPTRMIQYVPSVPLPLGERRPVSLPFSHKQILAGHKYRHALALALLLDPRALPVDLWGRGAAGFAAKHKIPDARVKDVFSKLEPYTDYQFSIVIENVREGHYFSEKVYLPIYCGCTPLYLGTTHIDEYFPGGTLKLTGDLARDVDLVARVCAGHVPPCNVQSAKLQFQDKWDWLKYLHNTFVR